MPTFKGDQEAIADQLRRKGLIREEAPVRLPAGAPQPKKKRGRPEEEFQQAVIALARLRGWKVAHFRPVRVQRKNGSVYYETPVGADGAGFPDLILLRRERMIAAELKAGKNTTTPDQDDWLNAFHAAAFVEVHIWHPDRWQLIEELLR